MLQMGDYPDDVNQLPGEEPEQVYYFGVSGEIEVEAYSEEGAEQNLKDNLSEILLNAYYNGDIEID